MLRKLAFNCEFSLWDGFVEQIKIYRNMERIASRLSNH